MIAVSDAGDSWTLSKRTGVTVMDDHHATQIDFGKERTIREISSLLRSSYPFSYCDELLCVLLRRQLEPVEGLEAPERA